MLKSYHPECVQVIHRNLEPANMAREVGTVREGVTRDEARRLLHLHRIEKLAVVDDSGCCVGRRQRRGRCI
jgi:CBS-domain-containing membrane protein